MDAWAKWVYRSKKLAVQFFSISYLQKWAGDFAPILVNLLGACFVVCCKNQVPMLLGSYSNYGHAAIGVFEPLNDDIANSSNSFANWNVNLKISMRVLAQHESVVIKGAMQHAA